MKAQVAALTITASLFLVLLSLGGCATTPSSSSAAVVTESSVSVVLLSDKELRSQYGRTNSENPFVAASPTVMPKNYEYIALRITTSSPSPASLEILQAEAQDEKGKVKASFYNREQFADFASSATLDPTNITVRQNKITWYYLPAARMRVDAGKSSYLMILIGNHPLPPSLVVGVRLLFNGTEQDFSLPFSDAE